MIPIFLAFLLAAGTLAFPRWLELLFGIDPDAGSGLVESALVLSCVLIVVVLLRRELVRRR